MVQPAQSHLNAGILSFCHHNAGHVEENIRRRFYLTRVDELLDADGGSCFVSVMNAIRHYDDFVEVKGLKRFLSLRCSRQGDQGQSAGNSHHLFSHR